MENQYQCHANHPCRKEKRFFHFPSYVKKWLAEKTIGVEITHALFLI